MLVVTWDMEPICREVIMMGSIMEGLMEPVEMAVMVEWVVLAPQ